MIELTPQLLINAYCRGIFPMSHNGQIYWYDPDPRAILPLERLHISKSLSRTLKRVRVTEDGESRPFIKPEAPRKSTKTHFEMRINSDFYGVITSCADPRRPGGWIDDQILGSYMKLHELGWAHSIETWQDGRLVGGLYGVAVRGLFAGESMFSYVTDASKVALVYLVHHMKRRGLTLLDVQFQTSHLSKLGVIEVPRVMYKQLLMDALHIEPIPQFALHSATVSEV